MVRSEILSHVEFGYLGVSFTGSEGRMEQEVDRFGGASGKWFGLCWSKAGAQPKGEALDLLVNLRSSPQLYSWTVGCDWKNEITDTSGYN